MTTKIKMFLLLVCFSTIAFSYKLIKEERSIVNKPANGIAIVELFTSEGCSSCPPADRLLSKIAAENKEAYVLSYHVDYWNHLGWNDRFSQAEFTYRQRQYAKRFKLESVYTPQVVINGVEEFVGSDELRLLSSLTKNSNLGSIEVQVNRKDAATLKLSYDLKTSDPLLLQIAFIQPKEISTIKRGENAGRTLSHVNVVRQLKTMEVQSATGFVELRIPPSLQTTAFDLVLFTQQKNNEKIKAATRIMFPGASTK